MRMRIHDQCSTYFHLGTISTKMRLHYFLRVFTTLFLLQLAAMTTASEDLGFLRDNLETHRPYTLPVKGTWQWTAQNHESIIRSLGQKVDGLSLQLRQLNETMSNAVIIMVKSIQTLGANLETLASKIQIQEQKLHALEFQDTVHELGNKKQDEILLQQGSSIRKQGHRIWTLERKDTFVWNIANFSSKLRNAKSGNTTIVYSDSFTTSEPQTLGYKVQAYIRPNGVGSGNGAYLSIFLRVLLGDYDEYLRWPFVALVSFTLYDQNDSKQRTADLTETLSTGRMGDDWGFCKPTNASSEHGWGYHQFVSHQMLFDPRYSYLLDDTLIIGIKVEPITYTSPPATRPPCLS